MRLPPLLWCLLPLFAALSFAAENPKLSKADGTDFFENKVRPILSANCCACHSDKLQQSGLRLDSRAVMLKGGKRGAAVVPGKPEQSLLIKAIRHEGDLKMPPTGKLKDDDIATLTEWVKSGAVSSEQLAVSSDKTHWSFCPVRKPPVPAVKNKWWVRNLIDTFALARLEKEGLKPSPYADRRTLIRRVSFDLTGLPPTPEEVDAFVNDKSPDAWAKVVDRLLASKHFGERMALHWLDLARYADTDGYHDDTDRSMWAFRDYVINAFNQNKPFNQFTIEQLAGDILWSTGQLVNGSNESTGQWVNQSKNKPIDPLTHLPIDSYELLIASAFNRCGPTSSEGGAIVEEYAAKYAVDRVNTTASVWLGVTMQCAECHDHKYDPLMTKEFYQLFAFFNQVPENILYRGADAPPTILVPTVEQQTKMDELDKQIAALEAESKAKADAADPKAEAARVAEAKKQLDGAKKARAEVEKMSRLRIMEDAKERKPTNVLLRGDYRNKGEEVQPAVPAVLGTLPQNVTPNRLALANWLVDRRNPLTARVAVNRFWAMIFGTGIVKTCEDFGARGELPSHPELLDWLAATFVESGWDVKYLLRLIVTSATYQQSSRTTKELLAKDPENRLLARGPRFRLQAELIRDNALAIAGLLDKNRPTGGPSVKPYQPGDLWRELSAGDQASKSYVQDHGADLYRRGLYVFWKRSILYPAFMTFDANKRETCVIRRPITNTPLQAFVTLNDTAYVEAARVFAQHILENGGSTMASRLNYAMRQALARPPSLREQQVLTRLYQDMLAQYRQDKDAALKLVNVGEYPRPRDLDVSEHAAWTCVCNAILNLDETMTKE